MQKSMIACLMTAALAVFSCTAHAGPLSVLKDELAKNPAAGKLIKSFPAQGGLTGVVLQTPQGQKMIAYVTPDGRYMIAGAVIDLANGQNLTALAAEKEIGKTALPDAQDTSQVMYQMGRMQGITFGNPASRAYMAVVVDPTTPKGRAILLESMQQAVNMHNQGTDQTQQIRFYVYGPLAAKLLTGSNVQQLRNLLSFAEGKPLPDPTESAKAFAKRNDAAVKEMKIPAPLLAVFDPDSQFTRVIGLNRSDLSPGLLQGLSALQSSLGAGR